MSEKQLFPFAAFYNGKSIEIMAASSYEAQKIAAEKFKIPQKNGYKIAIVPISKPIDPASL